MAARLSFVAIWQEWLDQLRYTTSSNYELLGAGFRPTVKATDGADPPLLPSPSLKIVGGARGHSLGRGGRARARGKDHWVTWT